MNAALYNPELRDIQINAGEALLKIKDLTTKLEELMRVPNPSPQACDDIKYITHLITMELSDITYWAAIEKRRQQS